MTILQRLLRGSAALLFLLVGGSAIALAYLTLGGKLGWTTGWNRIIEKGPCQEWLWAAAGVMLGPIATSVLTNRWRLRGFVALPGLVGVTLLVTEVFLDLERRNRGEPLAHVTVWVVGCLFLVLALVPLFVGATRSGVAVTTPPATTSVSPGARR